MKINLLSVLPRVLTALAGILILKVTLSVFVEFRHYFPPDFESDFLRGRESYFWGGYHWAFFTHVISGPASLLLATLLVSDRFRRFAPSWHKRLGRLQAVCVLLFVAPSGLWMAGYAASGPIAAAGLATLAVSTAVCVALGWRAAVARRLADHRRWMSRTFLLLCSAVVIRMIGGLATVTQFDAPWVYPAATWGSWLVPLVVFESLQFLEVREAPSKRVATQP